MFRSAQQPGSADQAPESLPLRHLAHELNSLLDGSLRSLVLAEQSLDNLAPMNDSLVEDAVDRLRLVHDAMRRMAAILQSAMKTSGPAAELFSQPDRVGALAPRLVESVAPLAHEHRVKLELELTPAAARVRLGPLAPVLLNGLRNAIEACASTDHPVRHVTLAIAVNGSDQLMVLITDTGPGMPLRSSGSTKSHGHGLGLEVCQRIVNELRGDLRFTNVPFGQGAIMQVTVPIRSLAIHG